MKKYEVDHKCRIFFDPSTGNSAAEIRLYSDGDMQIHTTSGGIHKQDMGKFKEWIDFAMEEVLPPPDDSKNREI